MKVIYLNCRLKNEYANDHRSYEHFLSSSETKARKNKSGLYGIRTHDLCDVGHSTGTAEVMSLNFFRLYFHYCLKCMWNEIFH